LRFVGDMVVFRSDTMQVMRRKSGPRSGWEYSDMRILLATSAAILAFAGAATPAFAQYGGSPQEQVEGAPSQPDTTAPAADEQGDEADQQGDIAVRADGYDKPGADEGDTYVDQGDADADVDQGDADTDVDQGDVDSDVDQGDADSDVDQGGVGTEVDQGDVDEDQDQADPGAPGVAGGGDQANSWQGEDGRTYCRRSDGTTGLIVGGGAGALVGRGIDGGRHRGTGTIIGAIAGAVVGSAIERSANQQSCR
jgi:hypothetical protein